MGKYLAVKKIRLALLALSGIFIIGAIGMPNSGDALSLVNGTFYSGYGKSADATQTYINIIVIKDIFKIEIDVTNKSDQEAESEIRNRLREVGIMNLTVQFEKKSDGGRLTKVIIPPDELKQSGGIDLTIKDGKNISRNKQIERVDSDGEKTFKDMTDAEIRNRVREDIGDPGLADSMIQIDRSSGSIKIKIVKEDGTEKGKLEIEEEVR